ncbi:right-handed parallel beta-helix repeat-containing protein [Bacillus solimangrovi]|uniref:Right handed beta helix domain-containing protein n=1 Tax=Bacillus solimangrovi TaxID=1305675 RepID=A0A1E5LI62_9BACI|nr:right-handed parallel beta-helix repeat-containing protein [Bacillus solimangrovi]OEH93774.1 hypothetical protein BFG57_11360 [Bacillus solimangrovi]
MSIHIVPTNFQTVQAAIDDPGTMPGDSIQILAGTFDGFNVTKERLKIFGCGIGKTVISGEPGTGSNGIGVTADQTYLKGFTVQGYASGSGIFVFTSNNVIEGVKASFNVNGIFVDVEDNLITNCEASFNSRSGFGFDGGQNCLSHCICIQNERGIRSFGGNILLNNSIVNNIEDGIELFNDFDKAFGNKILKNGSNGISNNSDSTTIIGNLICNNVDSGINVGDNQFNVIDENIVRNNGTDDNDAGILVPSAAEDNIIRFNKAKNNNTVDIRAEAPAIDNNTFDGNICELSAPTEICE